MCISTGVLRYNISIYQECLTFSSSECPLYIILDGLEHVSTPVSMDETEWVPDWLPEYTKVIISIGTQEDDELFQVLSNMNGILL